MKDSVEFSQKNETGLQYAYRVSLLVCPSCSESIVGKQDLDFWSFENAWSRATRVWADPENDVSSLIPQDTRSSLEEAKLCLSAGAYTASVVMSGRALEAVARHFHVGETTKKIMLKEGLEDLLKSKKIDERLYQ